MKEPCTRKCWECGNVAEHADNIAPEVCCKKCGSQDTRLVRKPVDETVGPIYGVTLIDTLPLGGMLQAMPNRRDLEAVKRISERTVAGYECLLSHYAAKEAEIERLKGVIRNVIAGRWSLTDLQEAIGDL